MPCKNRPRALCAEWLEAWRQDGSLSAEEVAAVYAGRYLWLQMGYREDELVLLVYCPNCYGPEVSDYLQFVPLSILWDERTGGES